MNNHTVLGRFLNLGDHDGALLAVGLVEGGKLLKGVLADDVGVEHKEGSVVLAEDLFGELEWPGSAERLGLDGKRDFDVVRLLVLLGRHN